MTTKSDLKRLTAAQIASLNVCPYCGSAVERKSARGPAPSYCSPACRQAQNNGDLSDGAAIVKLAKAWREARGAGPVGAAAFRAMTAALDVMLEADRKSGRPSALYAAAVTLNQGTSYQDRRRG
jgi:endogenous inhibitor of DNA gyrase (YacG/DUF329 family)